VPGSSHSVGCICPACSSKVHATGCSCALCVTGLHGFACACAACGIRRTALFADATDGDAEVPAEVEALDGIESAEEAHNADRPARSQLKKKKAPKGKELSEFEAGTTVAGKVKSITSYGAFVDIGAVTDGLLHISQLASGYVANVSDVLKEGQDVEVRIVNIDASKNQVGLSLMSEQEAADSEAATAARQEQRANKQNNDRRDDGPVLKELSQKGYNSDEFVEGTVVSTVDFGCFVRIDASKLNGEVEGEIDGLVHISALGTNRVNSVTDVVNIDDKVQVRCKSIQGNKVSLTMLSVEDEATKAESSAIPQHSEGAKDWKESLEKLQKETSAFKNSPIVEDRR
jgi:predicted RNA-binding protein with RPS1 domain